MPTSLVDENAIEALKTLRGAVQDFHENLQRLTATGSVRAEMNISNCYYNSIII